MGVSKAGLAGVSLLHVVILAFLFGARSSTGVVLPMLLAGDVTAVATFHQHARWDYIRRMVPPSFLGVMLGASVMALLDEAVFKPVIGWIILALTLLQLLRMRYPDAFGRVPHSRGFAWASGLLVGVATMMANAAGPIFALYAVAVALPKLEIVGTSAWFFLLLNAFKVPFSAALGLIQGSTLLLNLVLLPPLLVGVLLGRQVVRRLPQQAFELLMLGFAAVASLRLIGVL
jgi:hypothetical protein